MDVIYNLDTNADRPIILMDDVFEGCTALIDTGAVIPLWTKKRDILEKIGAKLDKRNVMISGIGGATYGDLYRMDLQLGGMVYPALPIILSEDNTTPGYFLFSATMFRGMIYSIDDIDKRFIITAPGNQVCHNVVITDSKGTRMVLVNN